MPRKVQSPSEKLIAYFVNAPLSEVTAVLQSGTAIVKARQGSNVPAVPKPRGKKAVAAPAPGEKLA